MESASVGLLAGRFAAAEQGRNPSLPPATTALGSLLNHITGGHLSSDDEPGKRSFQPMNINFGLFPELEPGSIVKPEGVKRFRGKDKTIMKRQLIAARAFEGLCSVARDAQRRRGDLTDAETWQPGMTAVVTSRSICQNRICRSDRDNALRRRD